MIEKIKYLLAGALALSAVAFVACSDEEQVFDEFDATYVYIARPVLGSNTVVFNVSHTPDGIIEKNKTMASVIVRLSKPMNSDVTVTLATKLDGFTDESVEFQEGGIHVIPAGELEVRDTLVIKDWSFALDAKPAATYNATISIGAVRPESGTLRISSKQNSNLMTVNKSQFTASNVRPDQRPTGTSLTPRSGWVVTSTKNQDDTGWTDAAKMIDGSNSTYVYNNGGYMGITVDLGAAHTVTGLHIYNSYGASYAANQCVLLSSNDGVTWKMESDEVLRDVITPSSDQYVSFAKPVKARYLRWKLWGGSVLCSELYVYTQN